MAAEAQDGSGERLATRIVLAVAVFALLDSGSQLFLALRGWDAATPFRRLSALQTAGTQTTVAVLALTLLGLGLRVTSWSRRSQLLVVGGLIGFGAIAGWLAAGIPGLLNGLLTDLAFTEPDRLARGSRQALAGWLGFSAWCLVMALVVVRRRVPAKPTT